MSRIFSPERLMFLLCPHSPVMLMQAAARRCGMEVDPGNNGGSMAEQVSRNTAYTLIPAAHKGRGATGGLQPRGEGGAK